MKKLPSNVRQKAVAEKMTYKTLCAQWRELKVSGDISALADLLGRSRVVVSAAVNHGAGSIFVLRKIKEYYELRVREQESNQYLPNDKQNYF